MSGVIGDIGSMLGSLGGAVKSNLGTIIPGALTGFGFLNNLFSQQQRNKIYNLETNPQAMARFTQGLERPLQQGAVMGAENKAQAALGERGLTLSPAIAAQVYSQALAPLYDTQEARAAQMAQSMLGNAAGVIAPPTDVSGPLAELMKRLKNPAASTDPNDPTNTIPTDIGPPTLPYPGMDPSANPAWWLPDALSSSAFSTPDWTQILGSVSPSVPTFEMPSMGGGLGS